MAKTHLIAGMIAIMALGGCSLVNETNLAQDVETEKNARIIVEVDKDLAGLSEEQILKSQDNIVNKIRHNVTTNIEKTGSFTLLNNAFVLEVNSKDIKSIENLPGVKSVTLDKLHAHKSLASGGTYVAKLNRDPEAIEPNRSAETMFKPDGTQDGTGTIVAILDNEFFFRGIHDETEDCSFHKFDLDGEGHGCDGSAVYHEVYSPLDEETPVRFTFDDIKKFTSLNAKRNVKKNPGEEGSLYLNSKVPFYYDYGGESTSYGKEGPMDYDVSSIITYHGSHVASITAANAPTYKGIAPKAQLACMKVFTNYKADETSKNLGFGDSSGAYDSCILAAIEDCIRLGVDGINMSLGSDLDDFDSNSITLRTLTKLAESGIMSAISAGNSGKTSYSFAGSYGNWTTDMVETGIMSSYANNEKTTTIASGQPTQVFYKNAIKLGDKNIAYEDQIVNREGYDDDYFTEFRMTDLVSYPGQEISFQYIPGFGTAADYSGFDDSQLNGKVFIVNRGSTSFADKYAIARDNGAIGLIIINNDPTASDFNFRCSFGDDFNPTMPCALVLYKDKATLADADHGEYTYIDNEESDNPEKYTLSTFSTDGATYNYDLKPEITAPGDNIRGAVPPQTKEHKLTPLSSYEYLSGTSMSAPNYAGAQALVLSKVAGPLYAEGKPSAEQLQEIADFRKTVDMRLQSTANPMYETSVNPENGELNYASPRIQGAGMVDLEGAYNTDVYLEGLDDLGENGINKAKIVLRNNEDISKGDVKLSFLIHNESSEAREYYPSITVMRPAIKNSNLIATKEYNYLGEISEIMYLPGMSYYNEYTHKQVSSYGSANYKDAYKVSRDIEYYANEADCEAGRKSVIKANMYYVASQGEGQTANVLYEVMPGYDYQSTQDVVLAHVPVSKVSVAANSVEKIELDTYSLTDKQKEEIAKYYPYGCAIEGFVEFEPSGSYPELSIPYLGFYSGEGMSYKDAPVVEPFDFEKEDNVIYPSYLVNDLAKTLVGKDNANMGSSWVVGYTENPAEFNTEKILTNDLNLSMLSGFHNIGSDPLTGEMSSDLYVGNPSKTNTMLIQQYVMRSVNDNYFTITNKSSGKVVYKSVLEDMLYGDQYGRYPLYKSHVDAGYLSAGYIGHRAFAAVPLYDPETNVPFADGEYEIKFNYQLVGCNNEWVSKSYTLHVDSSNPEFKDVKAVNVGGEDRVRFYFDDVKLSYGIFGYRIAEVEFDSSRGLYYIEVTKQELKESVRELGISSSGSNRAYLKVFDKAYGEMAVVIHFDDYLAYLENYQAVSNPKLLPNHDFKIDGDELIFIEIDIAGNEKEVVLRQIANDEETKIHQSDAGKESRYNALIMIPISGGALVGLTALIILIVKKLSRKHKKA